MVTNKGEPKEISGKPFISEGNLPDTYLGRVIIELWGEEGQEINEVLNPFSNEPSFVWSVDTLSANDLRNADNLRFFLAGLEGAVRHIRDVAKTNKSL